MTIKLPTSREQKELEDALRAPEGNAVLFHLDVDGFECGALINDGDWGSDNSSGTIYVDFTVGTRLNTSDDTPSSFAISVNGIMVPQMAGLSTFPNIGGSNNTDTASTEFLATSARGIANSLPLNSITEFPGIRPDEVVRDAARGAPYSPRYTRIDSLAEPLLYFQRPDAHFWPEEFVGDIFKRVEEQTPYKLRDNAYGGLTATAEVETTEVKDYRHFNASDFPQERPWRPPPLGERRYSRVVVFRRDSNGLDTFEPQSAPVEYRDGTPPLSNAWKWIALDDTSEQGSVSALNLARKTARKIGRAPYKDDGLILPFFDPLLEIQDAFFVFERWEDSSGVYDKKWMCWVDTFKHYRKPLKTEVEFSAALLENDRLAVPDFAMGGVSGGVYKANLNLCDEVGGLIFIDSSASWLLEEDGEITLATGAGTVFEDDGEITVTCPAPDSVELWGVA